MADRYHYLPSIGLAVMLSRGFPLLIKREGARKKILFVIAAFRGKERLADFQP